MDAKEFLEQDPIWAKIDDDNLTKKVLIEFAGAYHAEQTKGPSIENLQSKLIHAKAGHLTIEDTAEMIHEFIKSHFKQSTQSETTKEGSETKEDYCKCDTPILGDNITKCGTCNKWFRKEEK